MIHLKNFCELLLYYYFQLLQSFFAKIEINFEKYSDFIAVNKKINIMKKKF